MMSITILWENDRPYFVSGDKKGDCLLLNFGLEYIDDVEIAGERFFIFLQKGASGWKAQIDREMSHGIIHRDLVHELTAKINDALEAKGSFDIVEYAMANKKEYAFLDHLVCWMEAYRPTPRSISQGKQHR